MKASAGMSALVIDQLTVQGLSSRAIRCAHPCVHVCAEVLQYDITKVRNQGQQRSPRKCPVQARGLPRGRTSPH